MTPPLIDAPDRMRLAYESAPDLDKKLGHGSLATVDHARKFIDAHLPFTESRRNCAIVVDGVAVGNVGLSGIERRHDSAWAYYSLASGHRGNGYAVRALTTVADWAFGDGLFRLELGTVSTTRHPAGSRPTPDSLRRESNAGSCGTVSSASTSRLTPGSHGTHGPTWSTSHQRGDRSVSGRSGFLGARVPLSAGESAAAISPVVGMARGT
jgi:hypothetical protein